MLNNFGDILYATPIAKQIKEKDFPGCVLTWIVSRQCSSLLENNPFVDKLEIEEFKNIHEVYGPRWEVIENQYLDKVKEGVYDRLFILQPIRSNLRRYKICIRQMILDAYPISLKGSLKGILSLTDSQRDNVSEFIRKNKIENYKNRILFEFAPSSGQSSLSTDVLLKIAEKLTLENESTCVILTSKLELVLNASGLFNAHTISFKENAELINYCNLLVGCSSGISWLSASTWCKPINTIQFISNSVPWFNSLKNDFNYSHIPSDNLIELYKFSGESLFETIDFTLKNNFTEAKRKFDQELPSNFNDGTLRTVADQLAEKSPKDFILFFTRNFYKKIFFNKGYFDLLIESVRNSVKRSSKMNIVKEYDI